MAVMACTLALPGCEQSDQSRPLNIDEQAQLLREVRKDRSRVQNLTPREKEYLKQRLAR